MLGRYFFRVLPPRHLPPPTCMYLLPHKVLKVDSSLLPSTFPFMHFFFICRAINPSMSIPWNQVKKKIDREKRTEKKSLIPNRNGAFLFVDHPRHLQLSTTSDTAQETRQLGFLFRPAALGESSAATRRSSCGSETSSGTSANLEALDKSACFHTPSNPSNPSKVDPSLEKKAADHVSLVQ